MEGQSGLSELSVISWVSAVEGCPLSGAPLYTQRYCAVRFKTGPARCRVKVALHHTYITLPQVTSHIAGTSDQAQARLGGQDKGVRHIQKKKVE